MSEPKTIWGLPIVEVDSMTPGTAIVGPPLDVRIPFGMTLTEAIAAGRVSVDPEWARRSVLLTGFDRSPEVFCRPDTELRPVRKS